jgi:undecaprenyl-diphosphatase
MNLLFSIILGLVQGISEWLPISSKTQVIFASTFLFQLPLAVAYAFGLFMEIGSIGSAVVYFRKDIISLLHDMKLLWFLIVVTIVTGIVAVPIYLVTDSLLTGAYNLGIPMILLGAVLIGIGLYIRHARMKPRLAGLQQLKMKNYIVMGIAQGIAALPGVSRSGMTVSTLLLMGVQPEQAFRLSYLAYIPASLGGFFVTILFSRSQVDQAIQSVQFDGLLIAIVTAALVGVFVISYLLKFAKKNNIWVVDIVLGLMALAIGVVVALINPHGSIYNS